MKTADKIVRAKVHLQTENPFFAYLVMNLKVKEVEEIDSIGVSNNGDLVYNKKWVDNLSDSELKGVLSHEVLHLVFEHFARGENKNHQIYNIATDLVINNILINSNIKLPRGLTPYNNSYTFKNPPFTIENLDKKSADEVYEEIKKHLPKEKELKKLNQSRFDKHTFGKSGQKTDLKEQRKLKKKWNKVLSEASVYAKQKGKLPQGMERIVELMLNDKVSWKSILYKYITRELPFDYTYNRPSKRSVATGIYLPSVLRENIEVVISIDTSGSISQKELSEFLVEIVNISKSFNNISMKLIVCDSEIKDVFEIRNGSIDTILNLKIHGGGGTSHIPIYDYVAEHLSNTKFIINFTDGYTRFPSEESIKTIWVITKGGCDEERLPFGEVIKLE